jgi:uncharacterized protein (TIGR03435 family)
MDLLAFGCALLILPLSCPSLDQTAPSNRKFEVASVKLHEGAGRIGLTTSGLRLNAEAEGVWSLIMYAYNLKTYQVLLSGPQREMFGDIFYDVAAKADGDIPPTAADFRRMMQSLLADRFQLKVHREQREVPVYELVVGNKGPKLKESAHDATPANHIRAEGRNWEATLSKASMSDFVHLLDGNGFLDRPVLDKTGLTGTYDIKLTYTPEIPPNRRGEPDPTDISIFGAVQDQLGLKLQPQRAGMEVLIVDHVEKPTGN